MSACEIRPADAGDLPRLSALLPAHTLDSAGLPDDEDDCLMVACAGPRLLACARIRKAIGLEQPRFWFHVGCRVHAAADLGMFRRERTLLLGNDHTGAAEITDFCVDPAVAAGGDAGPLAARMVASALEWLRGRPAVDGEIPRVIAALPGPLSADGSPAFWNGLGRHFFPGDVDEVQARFGPSWEAHVAALLPRHPLVVSVLRGESQAAIGALRPDAAVWRDALTAAGLHPGQHVGIHDGGPVYEAHLPTLWRNP
ncbi:MAG: arginine N-succinyltransferase [Rhodanobacteraceae bacterium]|nr:arginine N-succinyltransferase [Rhodanobacteraceae bacterium]